MIGFTNQTLTATSPARPELPVPPAVTITSTQNGGPQKEPADSRFLRHGRGMGGFGLVRRSPGLAGLLAAQTISPLGDAMATTALILHLQRTTGSATAVGLLLFAQAIPPLTAPWAGVIADRLRPARLLSAGWLVQAVLAGLLALLLPPLGALLAVVFVLALAGTPLTAAAPAGAPAGHRRPPSHVVRPRRPRRARVRLAHAVRPGHRPRLLAGGALLRAR